LSIDFQQNLDVVKKKSGKSWGFLGTKKPPSGGIIVWMVEVRRLELLTSTVRL
jgi:hypothetical protein